MPAALELSTIAAAGAGPGAGAGADMVEGENRADGRSICEMEIVVGILQSEGDETQEIQSVSRTVVKCQRRKV